MMQNQEYYIGQIEDFLLEKLSEQDRQHFLEAMKEYPNLKEEVALRQIEFDAAEEIIANDIRNQYSAIRTEGTDTPLVSKKKTTRNWMILGSIILVCLGILYFTRPKSTSETPIQTTSPEKEPAVTDTANNIPRSPKIQMGTKPAMITKREEEIKAKNNIKVVPVDQKVNNKKRLLLASMLYRDPVIDVLRSNKSDQEDPFYKAQSNWSANNVNLALLALEKVDKSDPRYTYAKLLSGYACFKLRRFQQAEAHFQYVIKQNKMPYKEDAEWNLLLTQLAMGKGNSNEFLQLLKKLIDDKDHTYNTEAITMSNELAQGYVK